MAKFEDMLFELAMEAGKGSAWADELRVSAIGFQPPRIADGVGGLDVPSLRAGALEVAQLSHLNAGLFNRTTNQTIGNGAYEAISWTGDVYKRPTASILKVHSTATKLDISGWKWPSSLAFVFGSCTFAAHATGQRGVKFVLYDSGDAEVESWEGELHDAAASGVTTLGLAVPASLIATSTYAAVEVYQNRGGTLDLTNAVFGAIRIF